MMGTDTRRDSRGAIYFVDTISCDTCDHRQDNYSYGRPYYPPDGWRLLVDSSEVAARNVVVIRHACPSCVSAVFGGIPEPKDGSLNSISYGYKAFVDFLAAAKEVTP